MQFCGFTCGIAGFVLVTGVLSVAMCCGVVVFLQCVVLAVVMCARYVDCGGVYVRCVHRHESRRCVCTQGEFVLHDNGLQIQTLLYAMQEVDGVFNCFNVGDTGTFGPPAVFCAPP